MDGLMIAGTHTHSGPGNYFENNFYNDHASNAAGFDSGYFDYLSGQIAEAIIRACADRKPARIATGKVHIRHMTRNRSISPIGRIKISPRKNSRIVMRPLIRNYI